MSKHPCPRRLADSRRLRPAIERAHEFSGKLGREGHETEVPARQINEIESQLLSEYLARLVCHLGSGVASSSEHDLASVRSECVEIKLDSRILTQLMLHPVCSIRHRVLACVLAHGVLHQLVIRA